MALTYILGHNEIDGFMVNFVCYPARSEMVSITSILTFITTIIIFFYVISNLQSQNMKWKTAS